jgi:hypothetical protein
LKILNKFYPHAAALGFVLISFYFLSCIARKATMDIVHNGWQKNKMILATNDLEPYWTN